MEVVLVRHTSVNVPEGVCYGQTDVPLNNTFEEEAAATRDRLEKFAPFDVAYTSPLTRCIRLAEYCGFPHAIRDARIKEINLGDWEMQRWDDIKDKRLQEWYDDYLHVAATGGESFQMQYKRVSEFLDELRQLPYSRVVVFAHGGVLICGQIYAGLIKEEQAFDGILPFGSVLKIDI